MPTLELTIRNSVGLHARPASLFVRTAASFEGCNITVQNITSVGQVVNAKSILKVLTLGVQQNHQIRIEANGEKAEEALQALKALVDSDFGEK
jgi:phosphotransferase system HPr (HPr) family protein